MWIDDFENLAQSPIELRRSNVNLLSNLEWNILLQLQLCDTADNQYQRIVSYNHTMCMYQRYFRDRANYYMNEMKQILFDNDDAAND